MRTRPPRLIIACLLGGAALFVGDHFLSPAARRTDAGIERPTTARSPASAPPRRIEPEFPLVGARSAPLEADDDDARFGRWRELRARPPGPERDRELIALLETLAALDPPRALSLAAAEADPELRGEFFQASLRGWGVAHPEAALAWTGVQPFLDRALAEAAVFHGMASAPETALRLTARWSAQNPERAADFNAFLVAAFARAGKFEFAAALAADAPAESRVDLLSAAFAAWTDRDPAAAIAAVGRFSDPGTQSAAYAATITRWADRDGRSVVEFAQKLPDGADKTFALSAGLRAWAMADLAAASSWLSRLDASPELDRAAAVMASLPGALQHPQFAASWAENIADANLRVRVLASVVREWAATDPAAARAYAENAPTVRREDRAAVLAAFDPEFSPADFAP